MAETKADTATTKKAAAKPAVTKSAAEGENLPGASAPAVAAEAAAKVDPNAVTATEAQDLENEDGGFGPFKDTAPPVGSALEAAQDKIDTTLDFPTTDAFTEVEGDVYVSVRQQNQRNIVDIAPAGWVGPGMVFAPYQAKLLHKALGRLIKKLK